jgi:hypothetical protein
MNYVEELNAADKVFLNMHQCNLGRKGDFGMIFLTLTKGRSI